MLDFVLLYGMSGSSGAQSGSSEDAGVSGVAPQSEV